MKKILFYALTIQLILTINSSLLAQQGGGGRRSNMDPKEMAQRQTDLMKESLELTKDQLPKIEALNLKYAEQMGTARDKAGDNREAMRSAIMEILKAKDVELKKILTADQWTTFEKERKERMQNRRGGGGGRRGI